MNYKNFLAAIAITSTMLSAPAYASRVDFNNWSFGGSPNISQTITTDSLTLYANPSPYLGGGGFSFNLPAGSYKIDWTSTLPFTDSINFSGGYTNGSWGSSSGTSGTFLLHGLSAINGGGGISLESGNTVTFTNGAPEIDGGKLPLAALLLGLVAVIAQRKRKAALAA